MPAAVLFDIDGTLVDSVDLHARAWQEALARFGKELPYDVIRSQIGKGGDQLVATFLDAGEAERMGEDLEEYRTALFQRRYLPLVRALPGARELLGRLQQSGVLVGLASSCKRAELGHHLRLLGGAELVDAATTSDDAERSKPHPDIWEACLERLGCEPGEAVAVGDSPFDAESARRAGLATVGVLSGGFAEEALRDAGCVAVYRGPSDLLDHLAASPLAPEGEQHHR